MQELKKGNRYTITPSAATGDRSYTHGVHTVKAFNATHVQTSYHDDFNAARTVTLMRQDHTFSPADDFEQPTGTFDLGSLTRFTGTPAIPESNESLN